MEMLVSAWDALSTQTIVNCFRKTGISTESQETALAEDDDSFRELEDEIDYLLSECCLESYPKCREEENPSENLLLQGMQMLVSAWDALSTHTIVNCFRKSGISTESQETAITEDDDPFRELQDEIDNLRSVQPNLIEEDFDVAAFADVGAEVIAFGISTFWCKNCSRAVGDGRR